MSSITLYSFCQATINAARLQEDKLKRHGNEAGLCFNYEQVRTHHMVVKDLSCPSAFINFF